MVVEGVVGIDEWTTEGIGVVSTLLKVLCLDLISADGSTILRAYDGQKW